MTEATGTNPAGNDGWCLMICVTNDQALIRLVEEMNQLLDIKCVPSHVLGLEPELQIPYDRKVVLRPEWDAPHQINFNTFKEKD